MIFPVLLSCLFGGAHGHMGISTLGNQDLEPRERAVVGDAYRYPNQGHCHGVGPAATGISYAAGSTVTLTMSTGATHNGGHCALFLARRSDKEEVWFKQMDILDCTTMEEFDWTIVASLVPLECGQAPGCTLIWAWTPATSGACEIYMNCFDVLITSSGYGGISPVATTVTKNPVCVRVDDSTAKTPHFGTFCGTDCAQGGAMITSAPTADGATMPPSVSPPVVPVTGLPNRCGSSWANANTNCKSACLTVTEETQCFGGDKCFADMTIVCGAVTNPPTSKPITGTSAPTGKPFSNCQASDAWVGIKGMNEWCFRNCPGVCPASHCDCTQGRAYYIEPSVNSYVPVCQTKIADGDDTMKSIAEDYDLGSYEVLQVKTTQRAIDLELSAANEKAAERLLTYNKACISSLRYAKIDTKITTGITIYITGDCQLTNLCPQPKAGSGTDRLSISAALVVIFGVKLLADF